MKTPATTGCVRPSPDHWLMLVASEAPWRTIPMMPNAASVAKP